MSEIKPTIGSLCTGYGGLDLAVSEFFDAETSLVNFNKSQFSPINNEEG